MHCIPSLQDAPFCFSNLVHCTGYARGISSRERADPRIGISLSLSCLKQQTCNIDDSNLALRTSHLFLFLFLFLENGEKRSIIEEERKQDIDNTCSFIWDWMPLESIDQLHMIWKPGSVSH